MFKGFLTLTEQEVQVLSLFKKTGYLVMPDIDLPDSLVTKILNLLIQKSLIKGNGPWQLTKLGARYLNLNK